jgi:hypothetical protein
VSTAILQNLPDTVIRETIPYYIHVFRVGRGFLYLWSSVDFFYENDRGGQGRANPMS